MAVLLTYITKKLKGSTLVETLVASVIIIVIFSITSLTLNTVFINTINANTSVIDVHMNKLNYLYHHQKIDTKYQENFKNWEIKFLKQIENRISFTSLEAVNTKTKKTISKKINALAQ